MSAFTIKMTDNNGETATKEFSLTINPVEFWGLFTWDPANPQVGDPPGTTNYNWPPDSNNEFDCEITQPQSGAWTSGQGISLFGSLEYTGPEVNANIHVVVPPGVTGVQLALLEMFYNFGGLLSENIAASGTYDFPVTIPASNGELVTFQVTIFLDSSVVAGEYSMTTTLA